MQEIIAHKPGMQKPINIKIINKEIFLEKSNTPEYFNLIKSYKTKGAIIAESKKMIRINFIKDTEVIKLGEKEFDIKGHSEEELEIFLYNFYKQAFQQGGFIVKGTQDENTD